MDRTLSGATTLCQIGSGRDGNEGVLRIPEISRITEASLSDCLVSYPGHSLRGLNSLQRSIQCILQSQSTEPLVGSEGVLPFCRDAVGVFYSPSRLGHSFQECLPVLTFFEYKYHQSIPLRIKPSRRTYKPIIMQYIGNILADS